MSAGRVVSCGNQWFGRKLVQSICFSISCIRLAWWEEYDGDLLGRDEVDAGQLHGCGVNTSRTGLANDVIVVRLCRCRLMLWLYSFHSIEDSVRPIY